MTLVSNEELKIELQNVKNDLAKNNADLLQLAKAVDALSRVVQSLLLVVNNLNAPPDLK